MACEGVSDEAICKAVDFVVSGRAEGIKPNFCPSTAEFGIYARKLQSTMDILRRSKERPAIEAPKQEPAQIRQEGTEESRKARVAAILKQAAGA